MILLSAPTGGPAIFVLTWSIVKGIISDFGPLSVRRARNDSQEVN